MDQHYIIYNWNYSIGKVDKYSDKKYGVIFSSQELGRSKIPQIEEMKPFDLKCNMYHFIADILRLQKENELLKKQNETLKNKIFQIKKITK